MTAILPLRQLVDGDALRELEAAHDAAWRVADVELLSLCRDRMAMLLGHEPTLGSLDAQRRKGLADWPNDQDLSPLERASLALTEQYIIDVASITDSDVAAVSTHLGDTSTTNFVTALLVLEQRMRLELGLSAVLSGTP
jgi:hypothetical protein